MLEGRYTKRVETRALSGTHYNALTKGTSPTAISKLAHGLVTGDLIENLTRSARAIVTRESADKVSHSADSISGQTAGDSIRLFQKQTPDVFAEAGTDETTVIITGHGLATNDWILNVTRGVLRKVTVSDPDTLAMTAISGQTVGDTIRKFAVFGADTTAEVGVDIVVSSGTAVSGVVQQTTARDGTTIVRNSSGVPLEEIATANGTLYASVNKYYTAADNLLRIIVPGYIAGVQGYLDIAAARTGLGTSTLDYVLATPVISNIRWNLTNAYQGGSLIAEPMILGTRKPNPATGLIDITDALMPAVAIEQVLRHDVQGNGVLIETDVTSACTLTGSGTTITVSGGADLSKAYTYRCHIDPRFNPGCDIVSKVPLSCVRHDFLAAATAWTLTTDQANADLLIVTNAGGAADIIAPTLSRTYVLVNNSGQNITIKKSGGTGVTVATGKAALVQYNGTEYVLIAVQA